MVRMTSSGQSHFMRCIRTNLFLKDLIEFMTSGPVFVMILRHNNAVEEFRKLIGSTDPKKADPGTIRKIYAVSVQMNAVHGSDSDENAKREANFFFSEH